MTEDLKAAKRQARIDIVLQRLRDDYTFEFDWAQAYGEPGYTQPERGVLLGNWNKVPKRLQNYLEAVGFELEWCDEWTLDFESSPSKAWRTEPNSYHWEPSAAYDNDGGLLTRDQPEFWIDEFKVDSVNQPLGMLPSWFPDDELDKAGFKSNEEPHAYESGWHPGQTDDPKKVLAAELKKGALYVIFRRKETSQFYTKWECWVQMPEAEEEASYGSQEASNVSAV